MVALTLPIAAVTAAVALGSAVGSGSGSSGSDRGPLPRLQVTAGDRVVLRLPLREGRAPDPAVVAERLERSLPRSVAASRGRARITYRYDVPATVRRAVAVGAEGGRVAAVRRPVSSRILAPVVAQAQRNTCESAALEILLATTGRRVSQQRLQDAFPRSGGLDPVGTGPDRVWGDPGLGYVGRPDGGGVAGGFGVFEGPVAETANDFGRELDVLTDRPPEELYGRLRQGRAVMVWIGLSDGPYGEWRSPQGRRVRVNFGEHTVVLAGIRSDGSLRVVNPLEGTSEVWTQERFEAAWDLLDRRALGA